MLPPEMTTATSSLLEHGHDRRSDLVLAHRHDVVDEALDEREGPLTHPLHRDAVGHRLDRLEQRSLPGVAGGAGRSGGLRLHTDHPDPGPQALERDRDARDQAASPDRHDHGRELRHLFGQLQPNGALSRDHLVVVERMHQRQTVRFDPPSGLHRGVVERRPVQDDLRAERARPRYLDERRDDRHDDGRRNVQATRVVGERLGVVAGTHGDDPAGTFLGSGDHQPVEGATLLERARAMHALELEVHTRLGHIRERERFGARRLLHAAADALPRLPDPVQRWTVDVGDGATCAGHRHSGRSASATSSGA
jgi:hypothetical protein